MAGGPAYPPYEGRNPTRRYKWFRPRQAAWGQISLASPTNKATLSLFNDNLGTQYLVVRTFQIQATAAHNISIQHQKGSFGTSGGNISSFVTNDAKKAGALYSLDTATALAPRWQTVANANTLPWPIDIPFAVLLPGWSLSFQDQTSAETMILNIMWEAIEADELDFYFE